MIDPAWVLALMTDLEPSPPWLGTYPRTATAIAAEADLRPIPGLGPWRTAALLASVAWFEGRNRPDAEGDCRDKAGRAVDSVGGRCPAGSRPRSYCLMQVHESNHRSLGVRAEDLQSSVELCVTVGAAILRQSFRACAGRPAGDRLAFYAGGGPGCPTDPDPVTKSRHRVDLAVRLHQRRPFSRTTLPQDASLGVPPPLDPSLTGKAP